MFSSSNVLTLSVLLRFCFSESSFATNLAANSDEQARGGAGLASTMPSSDWCRARRARASESPTRPARHVWISWGNFTSHGSKNIPGQIAGPSHHMARRHVGPSATIYLSIQRRRQINSLRPSSIRSGRSSRAKMLMLRHQRRFDFAHLNGNPKP